MSRYDPSSLLDRLVSACFLFLVAAAAISIAVHLIEAVWTALLTILIVGGIITAGVFVARSPSRHW